MIDLLALPFDQYQRYRLVADLVDRVRIGDRPFRILDVGGRTALLRAFLPNDDVALVDVDPSDAEGLVLGDGSKLPYQDGAFEVVAAFDTLEHVPPALREAFVAECARVSSGYVFIAGPYQAPRVDQAEEILQAFLREKLNSEHRYLAEHRTNGLPIREATENGLRAAGAQVTSVGHANLDRWLVMMCMELYLDHDPKLRPIAAEFFRFYNQAMYASDHAGTVYRHCVVAAFGDHALPDTTDLFAPAIAPTGSLAALADLGLELVKFDSEADAWEPEIARLKGIISDVEEDLAGHKQRLSDKSDDLAAHEATLTDLRATYDTTLAEHAAEVQTLEADLAARGATIEALRAECVKLEADQLRAVADHKAVIDGLVVDVTKATEAYQGEVQHRRGVEAILAETQAAAADIEDNLRSAQAGLAHLNGVLQERDAELAALRARLRDRVDSLKRAFGPKPK